MLKRLYKRFLVWALAPVLEPVTDAVGVLGLRADDLAHRSAALTTEVTNLSAGVAEARSLGVTSSARISTLEVRLAERS